MDAPSRLVMRKVSKSFGPVTVVKAVDFTVDAGEVHALIGENGAGKSTLTKMIAGVHRPDGGEILLDGRRMDFRAPAEALRAGISIVYQELNLIADLDCAANIALGHEPRSLLFFRRAAINAQAEQVLQEVGAHARPTTRIADLSTGECQLVEIAKALATDAKIVIMDEPTAALSSGEIARLHRCVRNLTARGISVIYITHKLSEVFALAQRVSVMRDGQMLKTFRTKETTKDDLVETMLGRSLRNEMAEAAAEWTRAFAAAMTGKQPLLQVTNLSTAGLVREVSFAVRPGEILGMAGLVGAGRTETVRALVGLEHITGGEIRLEGRVVRPGSPGAAQALGVVMVPEDRKTQGLLLARTVRDNVALPHLAEASHLGWIDQAEVNRMTQHCITTFDVRPKRADIAIGLLSGGNQQKVLIGRWLLKDYSVVIFDEPSKGVDVGARAGIWHMIKTAAKRGAAVIVISSETEELIALSHRILVMRQGRISAEMDNIDLTEEEVMRHAF